MEMMRTLFWLWRVMGVPTFVDTVFWVKQMEAYPVEIIMAQGSDLEGVSVYMKRVNVFPLMTASPSPAQCK